MTQQDPRHWYNQPAILKDGTSLLVVSLRHISVQVIHVGNVYYVTAGDLFNSQTVRVKDANDAFKAIEVVKNISQKNTALPVEKYGWELLENEEDDA